MSETASPTKRSVEEVEAPEVVDDSKRPKGEVSESVLEEKSEQPAVEGESAEAATEEKEVDEEEIDDDELAALDQDNIIEGRRTRGKKIDWRKASEEAGPEEEDDDEDPDATANTTIPKTDEESEEEEEEETKEDTKEE